MILRQVSLVEAYESFYTNSMLAGAQNVYACNYHSVGVNQTEGVACVFKQGMSLMLAIFSVHVHVFQAAYRLPSLSCLAPAA
jgi:hypothetical protein